jgi:predicted house-cleaning noncanonical NTP pyrophosphatase (MazG superfamily)
VKLVRSKIRPAQATTRAPMSERELMVLLKRKLLEEAGELLTAETREEMRSECIDVLEVAHALGAVLGMTPQEMEHQRIQKMAAKGTLHDGNVVEVR